MFRDHGYEGASLSLISTATGLEKASLYHRFPGGKDEMAVAVVERVMRQFGEEVLAPLAGDGALQERVRETASRLAVSYAGGERACLPETMSLADGRSACARLCASGIGRGAPNWRGWRERRDTRGGRRSGKRRK
ncbi:MAG: helix-turn-helix domain-containing protein [Bryobacteraceae bacterium]|nr:helix-turn-helix domain-containing protein [Bryobacteraceae bacterium]